MKDRKIIYFSIALLVLFCATFIHFYSYFDYSPRKVDLQGWTNTAVYFNNFLTPILSAITIILLWLNLDSLKKSNSILNNSNQITLDKLNLDIFIKQVQTVKGKFNDENLFQLKLDICEKLDNFMTENPSTVELVKKLIEVESIQLNTLFSKIYESKINLSNSILLYERYEQDCNIDLNILLENFKDFNDIVSVIAGQVYVDKLKTVKSSDPKVYNELVSLMYLFQIIYKEKEKELYQHFINSFAMNFDMKLAEKVLEYDQYLLDRDINSELKIQLVNASHLASQ